MNKTVNNSSTTTTTTTTASSITPANVTGFRWPDYFSLSVCGLGIVTNSINIVIFLNHRLRLNNVNYNFMLAKSVINLAYLIASFLVEFFVYCISCPLTLTYFANVYAIYIDFYLVSCLAIFRILIEVALSFRVSFILTKRHRLVSVSYQIILIVLAIISLIYYAQKPFGFVIESIPGTSMYYLNYSRFGATVAFSIISIVQQFVRIFLSVVLLALVNTFNLIMFRERFARVYRIQFRKSTVALNDERMLNNTSSSLKSVAAQQQASSNSNKAEGDGKKEETITTSQNTSLSSGRYDQKAVAHITKMVIFSSFLNTCSEVPFSFVYILQMCGVSVPQCMHDLTGVVLYFSPALDIFVYYLFNKQFRLVFNAYVKKFLSNYDLNS